jgi:integrase
MDDILYLSQRRGTYYFRRRVPRLSTCFRPVLVSLGTTDRKQSLKFCIQLTAYMERMLDGNLHNSLPQADITAFFQAELRSYLVELRGSRVLEHIGGSLTPEKARNNQLETHVLRSLVEDGLRRDMSAAHSARLPKRDQDKANQMQSAEFDKFTSVTFNENLQHRAEQRLGIQEFSEIDMQHLRWALIEARMGAHHAIETVPLHNGDQAGTAAIAMMATLSPARSTHSVTMRATQPDSEVQNQILPSASRDTDVEQHPPPTRSTSPSLTHGVKLIEGRITANAIYMQREQALQQPEIDDFDGLASTTINRQHRGPDLLGTTVRMIRKSRSQQDTCEQKLKSADLFIYLTGVQIVSNIQQHHIDMFGKSLENELPVHYWKSRAQKDLTFPELLDVTRNKPKNAIGLAPPTIERHLTNIKSIIEFANSEGNKVSFKPRTVDLIPKDKRTDTEKRAVFTFEAVSTVFQHHLWAGCKGRHRRHTKGDIIIKDHHYWTNLLLAYTGARRSEIAGLLVEDVSNENGIPFVYIRENHLRSLKTSFSKRRIPLHPHIIELGFLEFTSKARNVSHGVLFPEAIPARIRSLCLKAQGSYPPYDKKFGDNLDHVWRECLTRSLNGNPEKYCLGSLRSYVNDTLINFRAKDGITQCVPGLDRRDILGHKPIDVNEGHYRRDEKPLGPLYQAIKLLPKLF